MVFNFLRIILLDEVELFGFAIDIGRFVVLRVPRAITVTEFILVIQELFKLHFWRFLSNCCEISLISSFDGLHWVEL